MRKVDEILKQIAELKPLEQEEVYRRLGEKLKAKNDDGEYNIPDGNSIIY